MIRRARRKIPFRQQLTATECGAACLAMVLSHFGSDVGVEEVAAGLRGGRDGANARAMLDCARIWGLRGRGVQLDVDELHLLPRASILHWGFDHFVVFDRLRGDAAEILDPVVGRRRVSRDELRRAFTGVAVVFEPTAAIVTRQRRSSAMYQYLRRMLAASGSWSAILVTSLVLQLFALALPVLTGTVVDRVLPHSDRHLLSVMALGLASVVVFHALTSLVRHYLLLHLRTRLDAHLMQSFLEHMLDLPYSFFQQRPAGDLMMRLNSNATVREILTSTTISTVIDGFLVVGYFAILALISPATALLALLLALLQLSVLLGFWRKQREHMIEALRAQAASESYLVEMMSGIETLKASGSELRAAERWSALFVDQMNVALARGRTTALADTLTGALRVAAPLALLCFGATQVLDGTLSLGHMLAVQALANGLLMPLSALVASGSQLLVLGGYVERIDDVLRSPKEQDASRARHTPRLNGGVTLENITFRYGPTSPEVVRDASVTITPGQFVAVVGRSGSGKSTLANLLLGLLQPTGGRILYDSADLRDLDWRALRRQLGIVTQRAYLFGGTLRDNIALGHPGLSLEDVVRAAKQACVHADIMSMPLQYNTPLVDGGASLSGGQRQRVSLARALAGAPAILLLDEATSALDAVTEEAVQKKLAALGCTRIVIAHRLSTIRDADVILVMEEGRIVERGRHAELMARGGAYASLVGAQERPVAPLAVA